MHTVAVFGGSFNPPHVSHVLVAAHVLATAPVDALWVVPAFEHPFGKPLVAFAHRLAMCNRAFADLRRVVVSDIEQQLGGASRTLVTVQTLQAQHPDWSLRLVIGSDILAESHKWFGWDELVSRAPPIVVGREGYPGGELRLLPEAASRDLRLALSRGENVSALVPRAVLSYIAEHGLYRGAP